MNDPEFAYIESHADRPVIHFGSPPGAQFYAPDPAPTVKQSRTVRSWIRSLISREYK